MWTDFFFFFFFFFFLFFFRGGRTSGIVGRIVSFCSLLLLFLIILSRSSPLPAFLQLSLETLILASTVQAMCPTTGWLPSRRWSWRNRCATSTRLWWVRRQRRRSSTFSRMLEGERCMNYIIKLIKLGRGWGCIDDIVGGWYLRAWA